LIVFGVGIGRDYYPRGDKGAKQQVIIDLFHTHGGNIAGHLSNYPKQIGLTTST
jgi:hypothetical protein